MPKKITIEDVKIFIKERDINNECTLLSTEYINSSTPMKFRCNLCGKEFERDYAHLKRGRFRCATCGRKAGGGKNKFNILDVIEYLKENDVNNECTLLSTEYINNSTPMKFRCNLCGKEFERDFIHLKKNRFKCPTCGITAGAKKLEYSKELVEKDIFEKKGYIMIGEYINASTPFKVKCDKNHIFNLKYSAFLKGHSGCKKCANINLRGSNHPNWNGGGHQDVTDAFRHSIISWKNACLKNANFKCDISGKSNNLVVHHLSNFSDILKSTLKDLGLPYYNKISEYSEEERILAENELLKRHSIELGVVLNRDIHNKFHDQYGKTNNTKEQYVEFKKNLTKTN